MPYFYINMFYIQFDESFIVILTRNWPPFFFHLAEESSTEVDTEVEIATSQKVITVTKEVEQTVIEEEVILKYM